MVLFIRLLSKGQIDLFENYLYSMGLDQKKKKLLGTTQKI